MFKHLLAAAALTVGLGATSAQAALLDLTEILSFKSGGFNSSMIHYQNKGRMNGKVPADVDNAITGGTFDTVTGDINFMGSVTFRSDNSSSAFTASGSLFDSARPNGLFGNISMSFTSGKWAGTVLDFIFDDENYTTGGEPNGYASNGVTNYIALWGDTSAYRSANNGKKFCKNNIGKCHGLDIRIAYEDNGGGQGVVPLPASFAFMLAGLGGLGVARKLRKKA